MTQSPFSEQTEANGFPSNIDSEGFEWEELPPFPDLSQGGTSFIGASTTPQTSPSKNLPASPGAPRTRGLVSTPRVVRRNVGMTGSPYQPSPPYQRFSHQDSRLPPSSPHVTVLSVEGERRQGYSEYPTNAPDSDGEEYDANGDAAVDDTPVFPPTPSPSNPKGFTCYILFCGTRPGVYLDW